MFLIAERSSGVSRLGTAVIRQQTRCAIATAVLVAAMCSKARAQDFTPDPDRARLEVEDIRRLGRAIGSLGPSAPGLAAAIDRDYLAVASPGMRQYAQDYNVTGASIAAAIAASPDTYADLAGYAGVVAGQERAIRSAFRKLKELLPRAVFPTVWFVAGHNGPGGLTDRVGVLIAAERFRSNPDDLVPIVMHEVAHYQSAVIQGPEVFQKLFGPEGTLLGRALREGSAELVAELTAGRHINPAAARYGSSRERELWTRFRADMNRRETGDWMFVRPVSGEPADLGYWIGYRIVKRYYDRAADKAQALVEILGLTDFTGFLEASRYAP